MTTLRVEQIFHSIQKETSFIGERSAFLRLAGPECGTVKSFEQIFVELKSFDCRLVTIIARGNSILQKGLPAFTEFVDEHSMIVLLETDIENDRHPITKTIENCLYFLPVPSSKKHLDIQNVSFAFRTDFLKFLISDKRDFLFAKDLIDSELWRYDHISMETTGALRTTELITWVLESRLNVRITPTWN